MSPLEPHEREEDEQWRLRFRKKLGITEVEARLDLLEAKSGLRTPFTPLSTPLPPGEWYLRRPMLAAVAGVTGLMTWGALWFYLMYRLAKWLSH